jgi:hypothetical protein
MTPLERAARAICERHVERGGPDSRYGSIESRVDLWWHHCVDDFEVGLLAIATPEAIPDAAVEAFGRAFLAYLTSDAAGGEDIVKSSATGIRLGFAAALRVIAETKS